MGATQPRKRTWAGDGRGLARVLDPLAAKLDCVDRAAGSANADQLAEEQIEPIASFCSSDGGSTVSSLPSTRCALLWFRKGPDLKIRLFARSLHARHRPRRSTLIS